MKNFRSLKFKQDPAPRYWWFHNIENNYVPPIFDFLTDDEWKIIDEWYAETDAKGTAGEANVPVLSVLQGFIQGSNTRNIVQLGHYEGFSTLLLGFMLKRMQLKNSLFTIDIDVAVSEKTQYWVDRAGLQDYVKVVISNSSEAELPDEARKYFNGEINIVFIDSSHQYAHTLEELDLWYQNLKDQGFILLHDVSVFASAFDYTKLGGVNKAIREWARKKDAPFLLLNEKVGQSKNYEFHDLAYKDACGLGMIQKQG